MARPTILTEELKERARLYIEECEDSETDYHKTRGEKSDGYERLVKVKLPTVEGLSLYLEVARSSIYLWKDQDEEFSDIIDILLQKQANALINKGLSGDYNPTIAKVLLTKHGYTEKIETDITSKGEKLNITSAHVEIAKKYEEELKDNL